MQYRFFSDLHLEWDVSSVKRASVADLWQPVAHADDAKTVLIIAGDIWNGTRPLAFAGRNWLKILSSRFKAVVMVLGNHDYWGSNLHTLPAKWRAQIKKDALANVHLLELADGVEHGSVVIDGIRLLGGTLWTDMNRKDPLVVTKFDFEVGMDGRPVYNDRNYIRATSIYHGLTAKHWLARHHETCHRLRDALTVGVEPVLLITHHAPCLVSTPPRGSDILSSYLYGSDLSDLILDHPRVKQVIHGHIHAKKDYLMGDVRIQCNPRGYAPADLVNGFDVDGFGAI